MNELLKQGEPGSVVLEKMRSHYSTLSCLRVNTGVLRNMYDGDENPEFLREFENIKREFPDKLDQIQKSLHPKIANGIVLNHIDSEELGQKLKSLPSRLPENVRTIHITKKESKICKKNGIKTRMASTIQKKSVNGRTLLQHARSTLRDPQCGMYELMLALLLLSGRRMCEICNGKSSFEMKSEYIMSFIGQAKRKTGDPEFEIPCLCPVPLLQDAIIRLRKMQHVIPSTNKEVTSKYGSGLRQHLLKHNVYQVSEKIHNLRKIYSCIAFKLFDWNNAGELYIGMNILGHGDVDEPIVYTNFDVQLEGESHLGIGSKLVVPESLQ